MIDVLKSLPIIQPLQFFLLPAKGQVSEVAKIIWLVKLRWAALILFFLLAPVFLFVGLLRPEEFPIYLGVLSVLLIFNLLSQLVFSKERIGVGPLFVCFSLTFDLVVLSTLMVASGGVGNPFIALFLLNVSLGAVLIPGKLSWPFLLLAMSFLALLQTESLVNGRVESSILQGIHFVVFHFLVLVFWFVARSLGVYFERQSDRETWAMVQTEKQDRLRAVGALAAGFSHEFASPLNTAKIRIERIGRQQDSEDVQEAMRALAACEGVIQQMNSAQLDLREGHLKRIDLVGLLDEIVTAWREEHSEAKLQLVLPEKLEAMVSPLNFAQALLNVLDNAYEAGPTGEITLALQQNAGWLQVTVRDLGPGFTPEVLRRQGEPFVTTKKRGTGLGLYVVELFVQSMGGALKLQNQEHGGAVVSLSWPNSEVKTP